MRDLKLLTIVVFAVVSLCFCSENAFAYLDPGSGSYFFQMMLAALFGMLFTIKIYWRKIKSFFINLFQKKEKYE